MKKNNPYGYDEIEITDGNGASFTYWRDIAGKLHTDSNDSTAEFRAIAATLIEEAEAFVIDQKNTLWDETDPDCAYGWTLFVGTCNIDGIRLNIAAYRDHLWAYRDLLNKATDLYEIAAALNAFPDNGEDTLDPFEVTEALHRIGAKCCTTDWDWAVSADGTEQLRFLESGRFSVVPYEEDAE